MFRALEPAMCARRLTGRPTLEDYLVARHRTLDETLSDVIDHQGVTQVLELAAGLSPRGWRFTERYGESLTYLETDLAPMASRKRAALELIGSDPPDTASANSTRFATAARRASRRSSPSSIPSGGLL